MKAWFCCQRLRSCSGTIILLLNPLLGMPRIEMDETSPENTEKIIIFFYGLLSMQNFISILSYLHLSFPGAYCV